MGNPKRAPLWAVLILTAFLRVDDASSQATSASDELAFSATPVVAQDASPEVGSSASEQGAVTSTPETAQEPAELSSLVLKKGSNATLPCPASQPRSSVGCHWFHEGDVVNVQQDCDQYVWEDPSEDGGCNLRLLAVSAEIHEGAWQCILTNLTGEPYNVCRKPVYVTVREPNTLQVAISRGNGSLARTSDGRVAVTAGTQLIANCSVSGLRPGDQLLWTKEGVSENHTLEARHQWSPDPIPETLTGQAIAYVTLTAKDNRAKLVCTVMDGHGHRVFRKEVSLEVFYGPHYTLQRSSYLAHPAMQVSLLCPLHSHPPATYRWSFLARNGLWVERQGQTKRSLELDGVDYDQAGFYNCTANNSFFGETSSASELLYLNVIKEESFRPQKVVCTLRGRVREHVTLMCPTPGSGNTRWFFQGDDRRWVPLSSNGPSLSLFNVNASQAGLYKCSSQEGKARDGCSFIYLSLGPARLFENLQNMLGLAFCAVGFMLFVGLLAFVVQISKIKAVLRVQERQSRLMEDQPAVWTAEKVGLPYYSLPPAYPGPEQLASPPNNTI